MNKTLFYLSAVPFGPLDYWCALRHYPCYIDLSEKYLKQSLRNRIIIATSQGVQTLTIPVKKHSHLASVGDILIDYNQSWQSHHLKAMQTAYNLSPYFFYYKTEIENLYQQAPLRLLDFNLRCMEWVASKLGLPFSMEILSAPPPQHCYMITIDLRLNPPYRKNLHYFNLPPYYQCFSHKHSFTRNVSILDTLFMLGPETVLYLKEN